MHKLASALLVAVCLCLIQSADALIELPRSLNKSERKELLHILGFGTTGKALSNPYPLGGYSGLDVGMAVEVVPTEELVNLGPEPSKNYLTEFSYPKIIIGKGLYGNIDLYVHFIPFSESRGISDYGGLVRWNFFEGTFVPITLSINGHANSVNISNLFINQSTGFDFVVGFNAENVSLYGGTGAILAKGTFIGGANAMTDTGTTIMEEEYGNRYFVGTAVNFAKLYFSFQIDQFQQPVYAMAVGLRL